MEPVAAVFQTLWDITLDTREKVDWHSMVTERIWEADAPLYPTVVYILIKLLFAMGVLVPATSPEFKKKFKVFLKVYNLGMSLFSLACFVGSLYGFRGLEWGTNDCGKHFRNRVLYVVAWAFYYSKVVEYIDSWSLMITGKKVTYLQFLHHLGAPWAMWLGVRFSLETIFIFVVLNSFVHTVMYAYYFGTLNGFRPPFKPLITVMQITQFFTGFITGWQYVSLPCFRADGERMLGWLFSYYYVAVVTVLFFNFSLWTYLFPAKKHSGKSATGGKTVPSVTVKSPSTLTHRKKDELADERSAG